MYVHPVVVVMPLIPAWSVAPWVVVLLAVVALHAWHARSEGGYVRAWHVSHIAMGVGMIAMFLISHHDYPGVYWLLAAVFVLLALAMAGGTVLLRQATTADRWIWGAGTLDQLAMVYMLIPLTQRPAVLTYVAVTYLVLAALVWLLNPLAVTDAIRVRSGRRAPSRSAAAMSGDRHPASIPAVDSTPVPIRTATDLTIGVRITLAIMALAMAWMLLAMQEMDSSDMHHDRHAGTFPSMSMGMQQD